MPESAPLTINPCIFVGLGTTGLKILEELRRLFNEEFGVGGLPCFRYLVLETDRGSNSNDSFLAHPPKEYEKIHIKSITIPDLNAVQITPALEAWLDNKTLKFSQKGYETGAGHRRQAGRLCLWQNWRSVRESITTAIQNVRKPASRTDADQFLREHYFAKKRGGDLLPQNLIDPVPRVYIVGTLCGGTCSGTFIDVAYFFRRILHVRNRTTLKDAGSSEIIGMFTMPDSISVSEESHLPHAASCWAALKELDFYSKDDTVYDSQLPGEASFRTRDEPFTTVYLESMINEGKSSFSKDDVSGFLQMCAMNLFTEVVAGMAVTKATNRVNLPAAGSGFLKRNHLGYTQAFSSFGLSAIWYPRYRIAKALTRRLGEELANHWLGVGLVNPAKVEESVHADWATIIEHARGSLLGTVAGAHCTEPLPNSLSELLDLREAEFKAIGSAGLESFLLKFPGGDTTLCQKLSQDGEYHRLIGGVMPLVARDIAHDFEKCLVQYVKTHTLAESKEYARLLQELAEAQERVIADALPVFSQKMDLNFAQHVFEDRASLLLGWRGRAVVEYKKEIWGAFKERMLGNLNQLRDYFLKQALKSMLEDIRRSVTRVDEAKKQLQIFANTCAKEHAEEVQIPASSNIVIVSMGGVTSEITKDVELGAAEILKREQPASLRERFIGSEDPLALLERNQSTLLALLDQQCDHLVQVEVNKFQIGQQALAGLLNRMRDLVFTSASYFEPNSHWERMPTPQSPNFLFCHDDQTADRLVEQANTYLTGAHYERKGSTLDHFVFFYQETPGLAISDLLISTFADQLLEKQEGNEQSAEPTRYTHKLGRKMFDPATIFAIAKNWIEDSSILAPEIFKSVGGERFIEYEAANQPKCDLYIDREQDVRNFLQNNGLEGLIQIFVANLRPIGREELDQRMDRRKGTASTRTDRESLSKRHEDIRKAIFPPPT